MKKESILVTGGAGFIGSAMIRHLIEKTDFKVVNLDLLTYAGNLESLQSVSSNDRYDFYQGNIADKRLVTHILDKYKPQHIFHLAAESHVDRSIDGPASFIESNILGTFNLLECSLAYWKSHAPHDFKFQHISTDEVFGSLAEVGYFTESSSYDPSSPYSASKAASDHLVRAWQRTYGLPTLITNCSNNYGPYHFPEKLIPLTILNAINGKPISVYGDGSQVRDWLYVEDHIEALILVMRKGQAGQTYNVGASNEKTNLQVVTAICNILDQLKPSSKSYSELITFVPDRPGHDKRYAIDFTKLKNDLGWLPKEDFETGLIKTVKWFLENQQWVESVMKNKYSGERLGVKK